MRKLQTQIGEVWVSKEALDLMMGEFERMYPNETGGILMGYWAGLSVVITHAVGPGPNATHNEMSFIPDWCYHESEIARLYQESGRIDTYLGDWHSHPDFCTELSPTDRRTLAKIAKHPGARVPAPLMAIIGRQDPRALEIWQYRPARLDSRLRPSYVSLRVRSFL